MANYENEMREVADWLKHPNELGKAPFKMEFVKEFTDEEGCHCLIFKFKKGLFSPWLMLFTVIQVFSVSRSAMMKTMTSSRQLKCLHI